MSIYNVYLIDGNISSLFLKYLTKIVMLFLLWKVSTPITGFQFVAVFGKKSHAIDYRQHIFL